MEKNLINEDIRKMVTLIGYDRGKTLSENKISYKNIFINEAKGDDNIDATVSRIKRGACYAGGTRENTLVDGFKLIKNVSTAKQLDKYFSENPACRAKYKSLSEILNGEFAGPGNYYSSEYQYVDSIKNHFDENKIGNVTYKKAPANQGIIKNSIKINYNESKTSNTWDNYPCVTDGKKGRTKNGSIAYRKSLTTQSEYPYGWFYNSGRVRVYTSENESKTYDYKCQDGKIEIEGYEIKNSSSKSKSKYRRTAVTYNDVLEGKGTAELYDKGDVVEDIQKNLNKLLKLGLTLDGAYGPKTKEAVTRFQIKFDLTDDGIFKQETAKKLDAELKKLKQPQESKPAPQESKPAPQESKPAPQESEVTQQKVNQEIEKEVNRINTPEEAEKAMEQTKQEIKNLRQQQKDIRKQRRGLKKLKRVCQKFPNLEACKNTQSLQEWYFR